ncbi:hypothetical protein ACTD5D_16340 [Nocardia takedensis]|uniref:hypothetical protein n=1 Tax=Nocardia takedensis TaxID=259390 RepID=UPI0002D3EC88|nr:hypothetical protein [Nocardia takedensis]
MPALAPTSWDATLAEAFSLVLDRPILEDSGRYAAWYACPDLSYELFEEGFDPELFASGEVVGPPFEAIPGLGELFQGWDRFAAQWTIDLGESIVRADDEGLPGLTDGLTGREFGSGMSGRGLAPEDLIDSGPEVIFRVHTDGTLFDAMRALTGTHRGPDHLAALEVAHGLADDWDRRFAALGDRAVADHLRDLFRTEDSARAYGAFHLGKSDPSHGAIPHPVVTAWRFGEGQAWSAITSLP